MTRWLLVRGRGDAPLPARGFRLERHSSSRRPSLQPGELAIAYASVWQCVFAVVEIVSEPHHDPARTRWSWSFAIRPLALVEDLHDAPAVEEAGIFPQSLWRHSYIRLSAERFEAGRALILERGREQDRPAAAQGLDGGAGEREREHGDEDDEAEHVH